VRAAVQARPQLTAQAPESAPVVVCGVDDARTDKAVVLFAADLSKRVGGRLILLHVQPPPLIGLEPQIAYATSQPKPHTERDQLAAARELARLAADAGVAPSTEVRVGYGDLEQQLLAVARDEQATVVVVRSRAGSRPGLRGSRALRLIERAAAPVVVVPVADGERVAASASPDWGRHRMASERTSGDAARMSSTNGGGVTSSILCGVDGSHHARVALRHAARLARKLGVRLVVAHVVQPPLSSPGVGPTARQLMTIPIDALLASGEALVDKILEEEELMGAKRRVLLGFPGDRLADLADDEAAELIIVGSRGRGAVKSALLGSVSTDVIGVARRPVLVVPSRADVPSRERGEARGASLARAT
jgi:nucleotide-binding universal stress UspA family protein